MLRHGLPDAWRARPGIALGLAAILMAVCAAALPARAQSRPLEPNSVKRYMFSRATVAEVRAEIQKRGLSLTTDLAAPEPGGTAFFEASYKNGIHNPYVLENVGGKLHVSVDLRRPQHPVPPFPYIEQEVVFDNSEAGISLVGTLTYPRKAGPFPAAVLIHGSGAHTRDELVSLHKVLLVLADHLTRQGIAVLRYDKRGVGLSGGSPDPQSTTDDYASDVKAAVRFIASQPQVDPARVGLIGHSEGGIIAPMVAAGSSDIACIVLLAGTGLPGLEVRMLQENAMGRAHGADEKAVAASDKLNKVVFPLIIATKDNAESIRKIRAAERNVLTAEERNILGLPETGLPEEAYGSVLTPWFRRFLELDPRPYLQRVRCPVLALNGEKDLQVLPDANLAEIRAALERGGNKNVTIRRLPNVNHMFQTAPTGLPTEYRNIEETFAPAALDIISNWLLTIWGRPAPSTGHPLQAS